MCHNSYTVLDKGFVRLVDWMGDNGRPVMTARVSYGSGEQDEQTDRRLTDYLMRHYHTSPFEMVEFMFHIKLPLFVFAQLVRHRTANVNSLSARYSKMTDDFYIPERLRGQAFDNVQGSLGEVENEHSLIEKLAKSSNDSYKVYESLLDAGVAREMARMVLPQNIYTEIYWKQDLHNLLHLFRLRLDGHAQWEIRQYAKAMYDLVYAISPWAMDSWENHINGAISLSQVEQDILVRSTELDEDKLQTATSTLLTGQKGFAQEVKDKFKLLYQKGTHD